MLRFPFRFAQIDVTLAPKTACVLVHADFTVHPRRPGGGFGSAQWLRVIRSRLEARTSRNRSTDLLPLIKGIGIGLAVAAPVGPMSVLCMRRTVHSRLSSPATETYFRSTGDPVSQRARRRALPSDEHDGQLDFRISADNSGRNTRRGTFGTDFGRRTRDCGWPATCVENAFSKDTTLA